MSSDATLATLKREVARIIREKCEAKASTDSTMRPVEWIDGIEEAAEAIALLPGLSVVGQMAKALEPFERIADRFTGEDGQEAWKGSDVYCGDFRRVVQTLAAYRGKVKEDLGSSLASPDRGARSPRTSTPLSAGRDPATTPARDLTDEQLAAELGRVGKRWDSLRSSDEELGGGSPGEWMVERMDEVETEQRRRTNTPTPQGGEADG